MTWTAAEETLLRKLWPIYGGKMTVIAAAMGKTKGMIDGKSRVLGLQFTAHGTARIITRDDPAYVHGRTVFQRRVQDVRPQDTVLKSGHNQRKIGGKITKGRWKGFPVFCLTLEERATCSRQCQRFMDCYGNNMGHAIRWRHNEKLLDKISSELTDLNRRYPDGFVVRLHILGDFYSVAYAEFWEMALARLPALNIFGYTHWQIGTQIGDKIDGVRARFPDRFAIRHSDAVAGYRAITIDLPDERGAAIVCPAQTSGSYGRTCSTCALCWSTDKPIAFLRH